MTAPCKRTAMFRLVVMSWCWNFLVDFLWIPLVAYVQDLGLPSSTAAMLFAMNLGSRLVPNLAATLFGVRSEFAMMACVLSGYAVALRHPAELWALYACLTLHPAMVFGSDADGMARAAKYCGAARNLGTLTALVVPVAVYRQVGWSGVCLTAMAAVLLYAGLAATQHALFGRQPVECEQVGADVECPVHRESQEAIPWILWLMGAAFVVLELQMNICNAAVPTALTKTFGLQITSAGHFLAFTNGASMCFLAWLPSAPGWLRVLHKSPLNILLAFFSIFAAWCAAMVATLYPSDGLGLFVPGVFTFMLAAYMAQVLMLECLTGVLSAKKSTILMGTSETVGCGFAALGGYLGDALEVYGAAAPFALQASVALVTASVLAGALGHRLITQLAASKRPPQGVVESQKRGFVRQSLSGLHAMRDSAGNFVASEREYHRSRNSLIEPLLPPGEEGTSPTSTTPSTSSGSESPTSPRSTPASSASSRSSSPTPSSAGYASAGARSCPVVEPPDPAVAPECMS
mmetsp:Transcript_154823/g.475717  ORF Transcript_154823/g.475717 Transcript_154823/m.475717 type:complete len:518 (-) Transcript_154823:41-1594(-)